MKTAADSRERAVEILQGLSETHGEIIKTEEASFHCGCGETNAVSAYYGDYHKATVGYCENCGSDWTDEIDII